MMKKRIAKLGVLLTLALGVFATSPLAGDTVFSRYNISSSGYWWNEAPASYNTKASAGVPWYIRVEMLDFNGANLSGGYGMAYSPMVNGSAASSYYHWTKTTHTKNVSVNWGSGNGAANIKYVLGARVDSNYTNITGAKTNGHWNAY